MKSPNGFDYSLDYSRNKSWKNGETHHESKRGECIVHYDTQHNVYQIHEEGIDQDTLDDILSWIEAIYEEKGEFVYTSRLDLEGSADIWVERVA